MSYRKQGFNMSSNRYKRLLNTKAWRIFADIVKKRDDYKCVRCGSDKNLQAHHKIYYDFKMPWEYNIDFLETLCSLCHLSAHSEKTIKEFEVDKITFKKMRRENREISRLKTIKPPKNKTADEIYKYMFGESNHPENDVPW